MPSAPSLRKGVRKTFSRRVAAVLGYSHPRQLPKDGFTPRYPAECITHEGNADPAGGDQHWPPDVTSNVEGLADQKLAQEEDDKTEEFDH